MHLLPTQTISLDEAEQAVDLLQDPQDIAVLSFADSDLIALATAAASQPPGAPGLVLTPLRRLRHPMSVDLYIERTLQTARLVVVRCLGGPEYWGYGLECLAALATKRPLLVAALSGGDLPHPRLATYGNAPPPLIMALESAFRDGGVAAMRRMLDFLAATLAGADPAVAALPASQPVPPPSVCVWSPEQGIKPWQSGLPARPPPQPMALVLVYRSAIVAGDTAVAEALATALTTHGLDPLVLAVPGLRDPETLAALDELIRAHKPAVIVTTTAFSARDTAGPVLERPGCPILQAMPVGMPRAIWAQHPRGLGPTDIAMQVALPEMDGRLGTGPIAFKEEDASGISRFVADAPAADAIARRAAAWVALAATPQSQKRLALIVSDCPSRPGRTGFAVGLDTPASIRRILEHLAGLGFDCDGTPPADQIMAALTADTPGFSLSIDAYREWLTTLAAELQEQLRGAWGAPEQDPMFRAQAFHFPAMQVGKVWVALQPDRGGSRVDRKSRYHDPDTPPSHGYIAFHIALREQEQIDALIQLGTHGTLEWLPGKALALSEACWPRLCLGSLPVLYPFIVDDPGEAAPAKRRLGAVTIGHAPPPLARGGLTGEALALRALVEEYTSAVALHPRRAQEVAAEIMDRARASGIAAAAGVGQAMPDGDALARLDAHLCDLALIDFADGLHVFGDGEHGKAELDGLSAALDGRFVPPGPAGSPARGRADVFPTGRNLTIHDPRELPTRAATTLGHEAAEEILYRHLQDHGDWPKCVLVDLWASPVLRSGGEDIARVLALMGARPTWDDLSGRITGVEILPAGVLGHPRVDVTIRVSGAFRDSFQAQIALIDQAVHAVAALDESDTDNPLAAVRRRGGSLARLFGSAPGTYGAGVARLALDGDWQTRDQLGLAYLDGTTHRLTADGAVTTDNSFSERVQLADAFVHNGDLAGRDLLYGDAAADTVGGFAAAARFLGATPALYSLDTTSPGTPVVRSLHAEIDRLVRGRLTQKRWLDGVLVHGWSGAALIAQSVDALFAFAATTDAVQSCHFDLVFSAIIADEHVSNRTQSSNPAAYSAICARLAEARARGLWHSRINSVDDRLLPMPAVS